MSTLLPLSDTTIRNVKSGDSRKRLSDGNGLYLLLFVKKGSHGWRFDYTINARRKTISLGTYPATGLKLAREKAVRARELVAAGIDPSQERQTRKKGVVAKKEAEIRAAQGLPAIGSFEEVGRRWFLKQKQTWAEETAKGVLLRLENDVYPFIGSRLIGEIKPPEMLTVLRRIESRGVIETAHRVMRSCGQIFRFAVAEGIAESDPTRDLKDALSRAISKPMAAFTDPASVGDLLRAIEGYRGTHVVRIALRLMPMLMLRPGELRMAKWCEIDLEKAVWWVPAHRMKRKIQGKLYGEPHYVPLPRQAVELLRDLQPLSGGDPDNYVFWGARSRKRPMSDGTINAALRSLGYDTQEHVTGHGFRATARTMLEEVLEYEPAAPEAQLAHAVKDSTGRAYNRTKFLAKRRIMLQNWADYLDSLKLISPRPNLQMVA